MLKTFRVFSRAVNKRGYTIGITQNVKAENVQAAISTVINKSAKAGLSGVIIHAVHEIKGCSNAGNDTGRSLAASATGRSNQPHD